MMELTKSKRALTQFLLFFGITFIIFVFLHTFDEGRQGFNGLFSYYSIIEKTVYSTPIGLLLLLFRYTMFKKYDNKTALVSTLLALPLAFIVFGLVLFGLYFIFK